MIQHKIDFFVFFSQRFLPGRKMLRAFSALPPSMAVALEMTHWLEWQGFLASLEMTKGEASK